MQLLKGAENIRFADGRNILPLNVFVPLVPCLGIHQTEHSRFLHQISPYTAIKIAGNDLHCRFCFLHKPAAAAEVLSYGPVSCNSTANAAGGCRDAFKLEDKGFSLCQRGVTPRDNPLNIGRADEFSMVS